jgi:replicative DNA helicase
VNNFPHDLDAEKAVLCAVLVRSDSLLEVPWLTAQQFYREPHQAIWRAMRTLVERGTGVDTVTLAAELRKAKALERVGGAVYLAELIDGATRSSHVVDYAERVRETWLLRSLMRVGQTVQERASEASGEARQVLADAEAQILELGQGASQSDLVASADCIAGVQTSLEKLLETKSGITGISTGFADLDRMTRGLQRADLVVIAARPSMGKTALAFNIAAHVARTSGPVAVFSLEMSRDALLLRQVVADARVNANRVLGGYLDQSEYGALSDALAAIGTAPIWIDDYGSPSVLEIRSKARRLKHRAGLSLVVVDYLQLMGGDRRAENRTLEVAAMTRGFKSLAKELQVPVVILSQLNRAVESRADKRPTLADLRESGAIEQDADLVVMLYRDEYYNPYTPDVGVAEAIIAKARNGPTGTVRLAFVSEQTRFANLEER